MYMYIYICRCVCVCAHARIISNHKPSHIVGNLDIRHFIIY